MKPAEFAEMESQLKSHSAQLGECEAMLKLRTDELIAVRNERDDYLVKYERYASKMI